MNILPGFRAGHKENYWITALNFMICNKGLREIGEVID